MKAGKLREVIAIQRRASIGPPATYETFLEDIPCSVKGTGGRETLKGQQMIMLNDYEISMRYDPETAQIKQTMRVIWEGSVLNVSDIDNPDQKRKELVLHCTENAP